MATTGSYLTLPVSITVPKAFWDNEDAPNCLQLKFGRDRRSPHHMFNSTDNTCKMEPIKLDPTKLNTKHFELYFPESKQLFDFSTRKFFEELERGYREREESLWVGGRTLPQSFVVEVDLVSGQEMSDRISLDLKVIPQLTTMRISSYVCRSLGYFRTPANDFTDQLAYFDNFRGVYNYELALEDSRKKRN